MRNETEILRKMREIEAIKSKDKYWEGSLNALKWVLRIEEWSRF